MLVVAEARVPEVVVDRGPLSADQRQHRSGQQAGAADRELEDACSPELTPEVRKPQQAQREVGEEVLRDRPPAPHGLGPVHVLVEALSLHVDR